MVTFKYKGFIATQESHRGYWKLEKDGKFIRGWLENREAVRKEVNYLIKVWGVK